MAHDDDHAGRAALAAAVALRKYAERPAEWRPEPHQTPPPGDWYGWLLNAGRGAGKTDACAYYVNQHVNGPPCLPGPVPHWVGIIAPTLGDAATACFYGPSGIRAHNAGTRFVAPADLVPPTTLSLEDFVEAREAINRRAYADSAAHARLTSAAGGLTIKWPNGSEAKLFGAHTPDDVERLRAGGNRCLYWLEELAAWRYLQECWEQMRFGLRTGPRPHWLASTTPKPRPLIKNLVKTPPRNVIVTHATTHDNPHLLASIREALEEEYGGRDLGRQELYAEILDEDVNALWRRAAIEASRVTVDDLPPLRRVSVGVDPSGGAGEQGIVVVGKHMMTEIVDGRQRQRVSGVTLADYSCCLPAAGWGRRAVQAAVDLEADDIVVEVNFGGDMARATIAGAAEALGVSIPIKIVTASRGKRARAEPVAALCENDAARTRWFFAGRFGDLEDQLCTWTPESKFSPDRLDAMVWPGWHQSIVSVRTRASGSFPGSTLAATSIDQPRGRYP